MKKHTFIRFIGISILCFHFSFSQRKFQNLPDFDTQKVHWGFYIGSQYTGYQLDFRERNDPDAVNIVENTIGFHLGLVSSIRLNKFLNLRFEPGFINQKHIMYFVNPDLRLKAESGGSTTIFQKTDYPSGHIGSNYLHIPILLKLNGARLHNAKPYLIGGLAYNFNFSSNENSTEDNYNGIFRSQSHNLTYEIGFGTDFYFSFFKFSPSIRGVFNINNQIKYDIDPLSQYTSFMESMKMRGVFLTLSFE